MAPGRGYTRADRRRSARRTPTTCSPTPRPSTAACRSSTLHRRPDRQRLARRCSTRSPPARSPARRRYWSHTDLWDFQANVDGARVGVRGRASRSSRSKDPELAEPARRRASPTLQAAARRSTATGDGFVTYDQLTPSQGQGARPTRSTRSSEPLSQADRGGASLTGRRADAQPRTLAARPARRLGVGRPPASPVAAGVAAGARPRATRPPRRRPGPRRRPYAVPRRAPGRHRHARPRTGCTSPPSTSRPTTASELVALLQAWTDGRRADDRRATRPAPSARSAATYDAAARRHRRGARPAGRPG